MKEKIILGIIGSLVAIGVVNYINNKNNERIIKETRSDMLRSTQVDWNDRFKDIQNP